METVWRNLCQRMQILDMEPLWAVISAAYAEPHRHYHTLRHIAATATAWTANQDQFEDADSALLALFFHDIVYDPARSDNESRSADLLRQVLSDLDTARACRHILATRSHQKTDDADTDLLLDIDMSILGAAWDDYLAYAQGVAREYLPVYGEAAYATGRVALFLDPTLDRDRIFLTESFAHLEAAAWRNLSAERDLWQAGRFAII